MAKIEKYLCDKKDCKRERAGDHSLQIYSHSTPDASGNGKDDWQANADLCGEHLLSFTQFLIGKIEDKRLPKQLSDLFEEFGIKPELL
jgi:hypothetical protein